ncbi:uncharacterized protein DUF4912 [Archangium gephyra]|uniref:Alginate regulatory protein AlgP n=1 Tax=Archangium gephyra TaxID=48 RepID=A0AAC8QCA1_9BACT|nr:DUF4912 domain-containing protein [Archangium gephyra]AKJ05047.1 alginate regulatory protein AlgP [Archangium gephyra]REG35750.1 uncharacterized protein DUF4912 [Archangium gephyra]
MADFKSVTVGYLRELARKHLGRGHSKLKTKKDLLAALAQRVPRLAKLAGVEEQGTGSVQRTTGSRKAPVAVSAASRTEKPEEERPKQPAAPAHPLPGDDDEKTPVHHPPRPAEVVNFPPKPKSPGRLTVEIDEEVTLATPMDPPAPPEAVPVAQHAAEPLVEGFFVARMAGEQEAWRHHLTESQNRRPREALGSPDFDEQLGELPMDYEDDTALLLARDPRTLFVLWDFSAEARRRALDGLQSPRAVLRVYDDADVLVRVIDVALESRSYYIHGLPPGHPYRVEAHFVGSNGRSRRIGHSSNRVFLPPGSPSEDTSVRYLRMPPVAVRGANMESVAATAPTRTPPYEEREYIIWRRVALPGSGGFEDIPELQRERTGPGAPDEAAPGQEYLEARRAEGSSDHPWMGSWGPAGSSEQQWMRSQGPGGSSEQSTASRTQAGPAESWWMRSQGPSGSSEQSGASRPQIGSTESWWMKSQGPSGSSEEWMHSQGPGGSSEAWTHVQGPGGSSEQWVWAWMRPSSSGLGR